LQTADEWVQSQKNKRKLTSPKLTLEAGSIASMDREFHYFGSNVEHG
jgi:hypothetical protein